MPNRVYEWLRRRGLTSRNPDINVEPFTRTVQPMVDPPLQALGEQEQVRADIRRHVYGYSMANGQDEIWSRWEPRPQLRGIPVQRQDIEILECWAEEAHPVQAERAEKLAKMGILGRTANKRKGPLERLGREFHTTAMELSQAEAECVHFISERGHQLRGVPE